MSEARRAAFIRGATLGAYQAHALAGSVLAVVMFLIDQPLIALLFGTAAGVGWAGWKRDFGLRWRP